MTKEELEKYCESIGLVEADIPGSPKNYCKGYRYNSPLVCPENYIVAWFDSGKITIEVADGCSVSSNRREQKQVIYMCGSTQVENEKEIKKQVKKLVKDILKNIKMIKKIKMQNKLDEIEGDFV